MLNDPLSNALSKILNAERTVKDSCVIAPSSKTIKRVLDLMRDNRYIGNYEEIKNNKGNALNVTLIGAINKCGVIKPRSSVKKEGYEKIEKRYLPAKDFGIIIVSTPKGIMTHVEAKKKEAGGRLIAYCY